MLIEHRSLWLAATNTYLVALASDGPAFLVDAPPEPSEIGALLRRYRLALTGILLTHGHVDHTGGAGVLSDGGRISAYLHPDDDWLALAPEEQLLALWGSIPPGDFTPPERFVALKDGQRLNLAGVAIDVVHTPGHTPGHCCFLLSEKGVLFSGDQLFAGGIGRTDLPGGDPARLMESMRGKVLTLDDEIRVLPGHGPATTIGQERSSNPFLRGL